jgi:hypothetical protein
MRLEREMNLGIWYYLFFFSAVMRLPKITYAPTQISDILALSHTCTTSTKISLIINDRCWHQYACYAGNSVINSDMMTHVLARFSSNVSLNNFYKFLQPHTHIYTEVLFCNI